MKKNNRQYSTYTTQTLKPFPRPTFNTPAPQISQPQGSFLQAIKDGFALGLGSQIASRAVDSFLGPRKVEVVHTSDNHCDTLRAKATLTLEEAEQFAKCEKKAQ
jgi:hypothetical protein